MHDVICLPSSHNAYCVVCICGVLRPGYKIRKTTAAISFQKHLTFYLASYFISTADLNNFCGCNFPIKQQNHGLKLCYVFFIYPLTWIEYSQVKLKKLPFICIGTLLTQ